MNHKSEQNQNPLSEQEISQYKVMSDALTQQLDEEAEHLDAASKSKLTAARYRALEQLESKNEYALTGFWKAGMATAASVVVAATLWVVIPQQEPSVVHTAETKVFEDLNILASSDSVEFFQSLDFLLWLENESDSQG